MTETEVRADTDDKLSPATIVGACVGVLAAVALVLVLVLVFSGRLGGEGGNGSATPVDASPTSAAPGSDAFFLQVLHKRDFTFQAQDANWIQMGRAACADMKAGSPWGREIGVLVNQFGFTGEEAGYFIADSVSSYCPDKLNAIPRG